MRCRLALRARAAGPPPSAPQGGAATGAPVCHTASCQAPLPSAIPAQIPVAAPLTGARSPSALPTLPATLRSTHAIPRLPTPILPRAIGKSSPFPPRSGHAYRSESLTLWSATACRRRLRPLVACAAPACPIPPRNSQGQFVSRCKLTPRSRLFRGRSSTVPVPHRRSGQSSFRSGSRSPWHLERIVMW